MGYDGSLKFDTKIDTGGFNKGISALKNLGKVGTVAIGTLMATGVAAFTVITKSSLDSVAQLEQNIGGVETLFKDSADTVIANANRAYKTAGMSANEYMSTVTSFSASLLQSLGGDTKKAAEYADRAIVDMSDNANKMGTSMELIQNAYQGFAKQNYTMLDNLKLGYGGTKTEMERLLADAQAISGIEYDISSYADVVEAIHVIQESMGIAGTTAKEAATTIEGSMASAKAAWDNFLNGSGSAEEFADSFSVAAENILENLGEIVPRLAATIPTIVGSIFDMFVAEFNANGDAMFETGSQIIADMLTGIVGSIPEVTNIALSVCSSLISAIGSSAPQLLESGNEILEYLLDGMAQASESASSITEQAGSIIEKFIQGITENAPKMLTAATNMISSFVSGIGAQLPLLVPQALQMVVTLADSVISNLPTIISAGIALLKGLITGIINSLPTLIAEGPRIINDFADAIYAGIGEILLAGFEMIVALVQGLWENKGLLLENAGEIFMMFINIFSLSKLLSLGQSLIQNLINGIKNLGPNVVKTGGSIVQFLVNGIKSLATHPVTTIKSIAQNAMNAIRNLDWKSIGSNIISGIVKGLKNAAGTLVEAAAGAVDDALNWVKEKLGIHSPSRVFRDQVGKMMALGMGIGFKKNIPIQTMSEGLKNAVSKVKKDAALTMSVRQGKTVGNIKKNPGIYPENSATDWDEWERRQRKLNKERDSRPIFLGTERIDKPLPKGAVPAL